MSSSAPISLHQHIVVMGVSGCGKSTVGRALAAALRRPFIDADDFHSPEAIAKMSSGQGLSDRDREPWLQRIVGALDASAPAVLACSALRASYREMLRGSKGGVLFIWLDVSVGDLRARLSERQGHFAGADLLDSQFASLQAPRRAYRVDASADIIEITTNILEWLNTA